MKIVSCYTSADEIEPLIEAGAEELYTSVKGLPSFSHFGLRGNPAAAFKKIHALGKRALVALNSVFPVLDTRETGNLLKRISVLEHSGADAFIVGNPSLLRLLMARPRPWRAEIHLSSVQPCFNSGTLRFFAGFGIKRVIFPNQLAPAEAAAMLALCRKLSIETEIFDHRFFGCVYVNGRCGLHTPVFYSGTGHGDGPPCQRRPAHGELSLTPFNTNPARSSEIGGTARRLWRRLAGAGVPRIYNPATFFDFFTAGAGYIKYGTRSAPSPVKVLAVKAIKESCETARTLLKNKKKAVARREFIRYATEDRLR